ncbi:MAG: PIG-L family deacetylase [Gammaproteobacteria bacterium]|nr:PIG-L family deacetylase [Gammaproteobacteria bacterium]
MIGNVFRAIIRKVYRHLLPQEAKNSLHVWTMFDIPDRPPDVINTFADSRVLVLAPHMDDEVVGCGGTLRLHALAGAKITVLFLTDGRSSDPGLVEQCQSEAELRTAEADLSALRKQESRDAAQILGYDDLLFLDRPDGALTVDQALIHQLAEVIEQRQPQIIYFPCALELHPDHWAASKLLALLVEARLSPALTAACCRAYEAWTPLPANRLVDISDVFDTKLEALRMFTSQLKHVDYLRTTTGLNAYRAMTRDGQGYWEAYYEVTAAQHAELVRRIAQAR